jgi:ATP-binding cassette subfamily F protein 3
VAEVSHADVGYGDTAVLRDVDLVVERGQKLAVVGPNGAGKSTLLKLLTGGLEPLTGTAKLGANVDLAQFAQHQVEALDLERTVLQVFQGAAGPQPKGRNLRTVLGSFGFSGDAVDRRVGDLSGGERTRLAIAICLVNPVNLLILDEPTNHLDLPSCDVLEDALTAYPGTVLLVSHDRHLIRSVADHLVEVREGRVKVHVGVDEAVLSPSFQGGTASAAPSAPEPKPSHARTATKKTEARQRQQRSADTKPLRARVQKAERALAAAESAVAELNRLLSDPEVYADAEKATALAKEFGEAKDKAAAAMDEWMVAAEALEAAGG